MACNLSYRDLAGILRAAMKLTIAAQRNNCSRPALSGRRASDGTATERRGYTSILLVT